MTSPQEKAPSPLARFKTVEIHNHGIEEEETFDNNPNMDDSDDDDGVTGNKNQESNTLMMDCFDIF